MEGKYCNECKELLPFAAFKHQHNTKDGFSVRCLDCIKKGKVVKIKTSDPTETSRICTSCEEAKHPDYFNGSQHKCKACIQRDRDAKKVVMHIDKAAEKPGRSVCCMILENGKILHQNKNKRWS